MPRESTNQWRLNNSVFWQEQWASGLWKKIIKKICKDFFKPRVEWKLKHKLPEILEYNQESSRGKVRTTMAYVEKIRAVSKLLAYLIIISRS